MWPDLAWAIPLVILAFLFSLNQFLHGLWKETISGCLRLLMIGCCLLALLLSGWKVGLFALVSVFLLVGILNELPSRGV